jgi:hypothetical protein
MNDPSSWKTLLELRLEGAIRDVLGKLSDEESIDFPWMNNAVPSRMAQAATAVLEAVTYNAMWLERMGGLDPDWTP